MRLSKHFLAVVFYALLLHPLLAAPPPGVTITPEISEWYHSLMRPDTGTSCCSYYVDCREVQYRIVDNHYQVFIDSKIFTKGTDEWLDVPETKLLHRENPTGSGVACWLPGLGILCFVPSNGT